MKTRSEIKQRAITTTIAPAKLVSEVYSQHPSEILQALGSPRQCKRTIARLRQPAGIKEPLTRNDICIEGLEVDGEPFLLADSSDERRILVFSTSRNIQVISY